MAIKTPRAVLPVLLLATLAITQITSVLDETATWDEPAHLTAGYSYWQTGHFDMSPEHPALAKLLCALPLYLFLKPTLDTSSEFWQKGGDQVPIANMFLYRNRVSPDTLLFSARLVTIGLTILFACYVAWWVRRRVGYEAALIALTFFAFDPNIIAHGRYVTTDLAAAGFIFTTVTLWIEYLIEPRWQWLMLAGVSLGLAAASKHSALYLGPVLLIVYWFRRRRPLEFLVCALTLAALAVSVIAVVYWPEVRNSSALGPLGPRLTKEGFTGTALAILDERLHVKAYNYLIGLDRLSEHNQAGHPNYLLGAISDKGRWSYFPIVFIVKTPSAMLLALPLVAWLAFRSSYRFVLAALLFPLGVYFAMAMRTNINLGVRHLLPVYPLLSAAVAIVISEASGRFRFIQWLVPALFAVESLCAYPYYLPFFNILSGGANNGARYLLDSNLDWGQDFKRLGRYLNQHGNPTVCLSAFANVDFEHYGVHARSLPEHANAENTDCVTVVSATPLFGQYVGTERFRWLRARKPEAIIGHSLYVYDLRKNRT